MAILGGLSILYFSFKYDLFLFCFFIAVSPFVMHWYWSYFGTSVVIFTDLIIAFWLLRIMINGRTFSPASSFLIVFPIMVMLLVILSVIYNGLNPNDSKFILLYITFFFFVYSFYDIYRPESTILIFAAATFPLCIGSIQQLYLYVHVRNLLDLLALFRFKPSGLFQNVNSFGAALIAVIPFWLALAIWSRKKALRVVAILLCSIMIIALFFTNARASLLGFMISIVAFFIRARKVKVLVYSVLGIVFLSLLLPVTSKLIMIALRMDVGSSYRDKLWTNTMDIISHNPLLGIGVGNFQSAMYSYLNNSWLRSTSHMLFHAHNFLLNTTANLGIAGFLLSIWIYYLSFINGIKALKKVKSDEDKAIVFGIYGCVLALVGWSFFETGWILGFGWTYPDVLFWIPFAMLLKINLLPKSSTDGIFFNRKSTNYNAGLN